MRIVCPAAANLPPDWELADLLLPHVRLNAVAHKWVECLPSDSTEDRWLGVFAVDPFHSWIDLLKLMRQKRLTRVCNFPPVAAYDDEFRTWLASAGFGLDTEQEQMAWFARAGLSVAWVGADVHPWSGAGGQPAITIPLASLQNAGMNAIAPDAVPVDAS